MGVADLVMEGSKSSITTTLLSSEPAQTQQEGGNTVGEDGLGEGEATNMGARKHREAMLDLLVGALVS